ncbi:MAG: hypothetical protein MR867_02290 [Eubacterium sp.]|nr:hypothetical protein [Eubacterium sp.]
MEAGLVITAVLTIVGMVQWKNQNHMRQKQKYILDYAKKACELECRKKEEDRQRRKVEEQKQQDRVFGLDFMIGHGSAFGGCAAIRADGTFRRGSVLLDNILMYGKHPSGKEFTYYIEDQGISICATDDPDTLLVISQEQPFEIREEGLSRDQGLSTKRAAIRKDVTYYIILESKHEISIRATKRC